MTKTGYKTVLMKKEAYEKLKEIAEKENSSICNILTKIITEFMESRK